MSKDLLPVKVTILGHTITRPVLLSTFKYVTVGGSSFLVDYFLNWLMIDVFGVHYLLVGYLVAPVILSYNFTMHRLWSFRDMDSQKGKTRKQVVRYIILVCINAVMNMVFMYILYGVLELPLLAARVIATALGVAWNFPAYRLWVYKD